MSLWALIPGPFRLYAVAAALAIGAAALAWFTHSQREVGRTEVQQKWDASVSKQRAAALAESESNARETLRRLNKQKEAQDANEKAVAAARADAARNDADAGRLRDQLADAARRWNLATRNTAAACQCEAAGDAIGVFADLLSRADRRAGVLAAYADAARVAGLQCESAYNALTP